MFSDVTNLYFRVKILKYSRAAFVGVDINHRASHFNARDGDTNESELSLEPS